MKQFPKNFFDFVFRKLHNVTDVFLQNFCFYRAWFSKAFLKQRLAHSSNSAKTIPVAEHQTASTNMSWTSSWPVRNPQARV